MVKQNGHLGMMNMYKNRGLMAWESVLFVAKILSIGVMMYVLQNVQMN